MGTASISPFTAETTERENAPSIWHRLGQKWSDIQVGRQGAYSVERLESLEHYCKTTSKTRVALVCILTPLPALSTAMLLECLPLRSPSEGWQANWMFWIRLSLTVFIICFTAASEMIIFLPDLNFTLRRRLIVSSGSSAGFVLICILAADTVGFPVPYTWQTVGLSQGVLFPTMILLVFGRKPFARNSLCRQHLSRFVRFLIAFLAVAVTFPFCKVLYDLVPARYYACAAVLLPVVGLAAEHFMVRATRELEDFIPAIIAFSVDLLTALFVSVCISASPPIQVSFLFMGVDVGQLWLEFREVSAHTHTVVEFIRNQQYSEGTNDKNVLSGKLLSRMVAVTRNPKASKIASIKSMRLWACLPHPITREQSDQLHALEASRSFKCEDKYKPRPNSFQSPTTTTTAVVPAPSNVERRSIRPRRSVVQRKTFILEGLQLLFQCEYLVLVEYVECIVPLVFAIYKSILRLLPNAIYYPVRIGNWDAASVGNTLTYAALQAVSLLLLHYFLQRKFDISSFYQLAFVLETQMYMIQTSLFLEIVILLQFELAHLGECIHFILQLNISVKYTQFMR